jgi:hypothetical protein
MPSFLHKDNFVAVGLREVDDFSGGSLTREKLRGHEH